MLPVTNRVPSSPHSDTAANIHSNPPSAGQRPRPLSVPPTSSMIDRSYQRGELQHYNHGNLSVSIFQIIIGINRVSIEYKFFGIKIQILKIF